MSTPKTPDNPDELLKRMRLVRRDLGNLLFHFTRKPESDFVRVERPGGYSEMTASASAVLNEILHDGALIGTNTWTRGYNCVCFGEAPIQEFNSIFSLVDMAASEKERPRYEPYGIAVTKEWLFQQGGRPVIYDHPDAFELLPEGHRYRHVPYDPTRGIDYTWEREWRIRSEKLALDPKYTLAVVPTADEAFELVYEFAAQEVEYDKHGPTGAYHAPRWLAVSLDLFGYRA